jgi:ABC-type glycerol-3-phosphate transport system substrate-binding protein
MGGMRIQITARRAHAVRGLRAAVRCLLVVAALSLAACGGDEESPAAAAADGPDAGTRQAMADFAECMRENGIDFPDPGSGERGTVRIDGSPEKMR